MSEITGRLGGSREPNHDEEDRSPPLAPDADGGIWLRRRHAGGVAIVTTLHGSAYRGTTLSAWLVTSLEPLQILVSLEEDNPILDWIEGFGSFVLNILPWREQFAADQFAGYTPRASPAFEGIPHFVAPSGVPVLSGCIAWADCTLASEFDTGDHRCLVGEVRALGSGSGDDDPLIYISGRYRRLQAR